MFGQSLAGARVAPSLKSFHQGHFCQAIPPRPDRGTLIKNLLDYYSGKVLQAIWLLLHSMQYGAFRVPGGAEIVARPGLPGTRVCLSVARKIAASEVRVVHPDTVGDAGYSNHLRRHEASQQSQASSSRARGEHSGRVQVEPARKGDPFPAFAARGTGSYGPTGKFVTASG